jgi:hypothetical protein
MDICHMPSMYFMPQIAKFPIKQAYTCLNNILQLADIPLEKSADICELMGWELHLAFHPTRDRSFHDFVRILSLDSALEYREAAQEKEKQQYNALFPMEYVPRDKDLSSLVNIYYKLGCVYGSFRTFDYDASECFQKAAELLSACHNPDYFSVAKEAIAEMVRQAPEAIFDNETGDMLKGVIVRHLILPGHTKDSIKIIEYLYETYGDRIYLSIMNQYTPIREIPSYPNLNRRVTKREYEKVIGHALLLGVERAFIQEGKTADKSFIPTFDCSFL